MSKLKRNAIKQDFDQLGVRLWERINTSESDQQWYYMALSSAFAQRTKEFGEPLHSLSKRFTNTVNEVFPEN